MLLWYHGGGTDTEIRVSTESRPWRRKFSRRSSRDSNPRPFNHESGALTTELSPPHLFFPVLFLFDWEGVLWPQLSKVLKPERWTGRVIVQELCESRGGRPGLSVLTSLLVSVDVKLY